MKFLGKSLSTLINLVKTKQISAHEISEYFIKRVKRHNKELNVFVTEPERHEKKQEGLLEGLPIPFKDNFCTKDIRTTAASQVLDNFIPPYDATVVKKIKDAGGVVFGKTNMDAWAHGSSTETSDYGPTKNPYDHSRVAGGSSGGSAAVVASYLAPAAIGSETAGSIRQPAAWCGVVGLKPTYGRVSRYGVIAMGSSFDCPGPLTSTVEDAALLLNIIAGNDPYDATTSSQEPVDFRQELEKKKKFKIGISEDYMELADPDTKSRLTQCINTLSQMGHEIKTVKLIDPKYSISVYTILQRAEVSSNLGRYDGIRYGNDRSKFGEEAKRRVMLGSYVLSHGYYDAYYKKAQKIRRLIIEDFKKTFNDVDLILSPTTPSTALKLGDFEKYPFFGEAMDVLNEPAAVAGIPAINLPVGLDSKGLPIGMQIMGNYFKEDEILNLGYQFEKETDFFGMRQKLYDMYPD